jgi:hypothetical protein
MQAYYVKLRGAEVTSKIAAAAGCSRAVNFAATWVCTSVKWKGIGEKVILGSPRIAEL